MSRFAVAYEIRDKYGKHQGWHYQKKDGALPLGATITPDAKKAKSWKDRKQAEYHAHNLNCTLTPGNLKYRPYKVVEI